MASRYTSPFENSEKPQVHSPTHIRSPSIPSESAEKIRRKPASNAFQSSERTFVRYAGFPDDDEDEDESDIDQPGLSVSSFLDNELEERLVSFHLAKADESYRSRRWKEAESSYSNLQSRTLRTERNGEKVLLKLAKTQGAQGKWVKALDTIRGIRIKNVSSPMVAVEARHALAEALFNVGDLRPAKRQCQKTISARDAFGDDPKDQWAGVNPSLELMGRILDAMGEKQEAAAYRSLQETGVRGRLFGRSLDDVDLVPEDLLKPYALSVDPTYERRIVGDKNNLWNAIEAAAKEQNDEFALLLYADPNVIKTISANKDTPLHVCAREGHEFGANLLLDEGVEVDAKNAAEQTPLHLAAANGQLLLVQMLLDRGADVNMKGNSSLTALHHAAAGQRVSTVKLLLDHGADPDALDVSNRTPLAAAGTYASTWNKLLTRYSNAKKVRETRAALKI